MDHALAGRHTIRDAVATWAVARKCDIPGLRGPGAGGPYDRGAAWLSGEPAAP